MAKVSIFDQESRDMTVGQFERQAKRILQDDIRRFKADPSARNFRLLHTGMLIYQDTFSPAEYEEIRKNGPELLVKTDGEWVVKR